METYSAAVPTNSEINDIRPASEFKCATFSGYKRADVKRELLNSLYLGLVEPALNWSAEFVCSGLYTDFWDTIIDFFAKHVHIGHPKLAVYLNSRMGYFDALVTNGYTTQEIRLRNSPEMRKLVAEIAYILCTAPKKIARTTIATNAFADVSGQTSENARCCAPDTHFGESVAKEEDNEALFMATNELVYNLIVKDAVAACYWVEWLLRVREYNEDGEVVTKGAARRLIERRTFAPVDPKHQFDVVWLIWDVFLTVSGIHRDKEKQRKIQFQSQQNSFMTEVLGRDCVQTSIQPTQHSDLPCTELTRNDRRTSVSECKGSDMNLPEVYKKIITETMHVFGFRYTGAACARKRRGLLYFIVELLTETAAENLLPIVSNSDVLKRTLDKINVIYRQIKKNEKTPKIGYLFEGIQDNSKNLEQTLAKLDAMTK